MGESKREREGERYGGGWREVERRKRGKREK